MKNVGRDVVQIFYKDDLYPQLDFNHNSDQLNQVVADNVKKLLKGSRFHVGLKPDEQVKFFSWHFFRTTDCLYIRAVPTIFHILPLSNYARGFIIVESTTVFLVSEMVPSRNLVLQWPLHVCVIYCSFSCSSFSCLSFSCPSLFYLSQAFDTNLT